LVNVPRFGHAPALIRRGLNLAGGALPSATSITKNEFAALGSVVVFFHPTGTDASAAQLSGVIRMLHVVNVANLCVSHISQVAEGSTKVLDIDAGPALMGNSSLGPLPC
jgi:hypothetical protein